MTSHFSLRGISMRWLHVLSVLACALGLAADAPKVFAAPPPVEGVIEDIAKGDKPNITNLSVRTLQDEVKSFIVNKQTGLKKVMGEEREKTDLRPAFKGKQVRVLVQPKKPKVALKVEVFVDLPPVPGVLTDMEGVEDNEDAGILTLKGRHAEELSYQIDPDTVFEELKDGKRTVVQYSDDYKGCWIIVYPRTNDIAARVEILVGNRPKDTSDATLRVAPLRGRVTRVERDPNGKGGTVDIDDGSGETESCHVPDVDPYADAADDGDDVVMYPTDDPDEAASPEIGGGQALEPSPVVGPVVNAVPDPNGGGGGTVWVKNWNGGVRPFPVNNINNWQVNKGPVIVHPGSNKFHPKKPIKKINKHPHKPFKHRPKKIHKGPKKKNPPHKKKPKGKPKPKPGRDKGKPKDKPRRDLGKPKDKPVRDKGKPKDKPRRDLGKPKDKPVRDKGKPKDKPRVNPKDKPRVNPKDKPRVNPKDKPKDRGLRKDKDFVRDGARKDKPKANPKDKPKGNPKDRGLRKDRGFVKDSAKKDKGKPKTKPKPKPKPKTNPKNKPKPKPKPKTNPKNKPKAKPKNKPKNKPKAKPKNKPKKKPKAKGKKKGGGKKKAGGKKKGGKKKK
jgi:hypothetical protein